MNPELLNRIRAGAFVKIILTEEEVTLSGYCAQDPDSEAHIRLDSMILNEAGYCEKISLRLTQEDIAVVYFLPEAPVFLDGEGAEFTMTASFHSEL